MKQNTLTRRNFNKMALGGMLGAFCGCHLVNRFDLVIRNGLLIDGSGGLPFNADIGISENRIRAIGNLQDKTARRIINAAGLAVAPGFIDIHTHSDVELLVNGNAESKIHQGVTTEIGGNCGSSVFPLSAEDSDYLNDRIFRQYGINADWNNLEGFFKALDKGGISLNYGTFTGQGTLRGYAAGKNDVPASSDIIKKMDELLAESMYHGSFGISSGLEYAPGSYASTEELTALCKTAAEHSGIYATHVRDEGDKVEEAVEEALQISRDSGVSLQISHLKACNPANWHKIDRLLAKLEYESKKGLPVTADRYPYTAYGTGLTMFIPLWAKQGTSVDLIDRLKHSNRLKEIENYFNIRGKQIGGWDKVVISSCFTEENRQWEGMSILEASGQTGETPFAFSRRLLCEENTNVNITGFAMDEGNLKKVLSHPLVMAGSDGNAVSPSGKLGTGKPHPRFYGTFPRMLGKYTREEKIFTLSEAVKKMTAMPADKLGLKNRGRIMKGHFADIVVFDPFLIKDKATFTDPHQFPDGIPWVIVNGSIVIKEGRHTGNRPGVILANNS